MFDFLDKLSYEILAVLAIVMLLAPFYPMPHALEKIIMLKEGNLKRPLDIFDLFFHLAPLLLLLVKIAKDSIGRAS
jgi:hypothetical protein